MVLGQVRAEDEEGVGVGDVVVTGRRAVAAQTGLVAGHGAAHAQAAVGVPVVAAQIALEELAREVTGLRVELAGAVESDGLGTVLVEDAPRSIGRLRGGQIPAPAR